MNTYTSLDELYIYTISPRCFQIFLHFVMVGQILNQFVHRAQNWILSSQRLLRTNSKVHVLYVKSRCISSHVCLYFFSSLLIFLHMFRLHFSHLGCAQSMEAWCLNWWLVERFAVSSKSWSQNPRPHSSKLKRVILKAVIPFLLFTSDYLVY